MPSGNETDPTATPNTVLTHDLENAALPDAKKQRQEVPVAAEVAKPKSFKAVANLVLAMKRFQSALNPTYEYGKQPNQQRLSRAVRQTSPVASGSSGEKEPRAVTVSRTEEHYSFSDRGHKADILFKTLPGTPETLSDQD